GGPPHTRPRPDSDRSDTGGLGHRFRNVLHARESERERIMKAKDVIAFAKENGVKFVDLKFIDMPGIWQHTQIPVARLNENLVKASGIADTIYFGPEAEFFVFDSVRYDSSPRGAFYEIDADEAGWNSGKAGPNLGHKTRQKEGYFPVPPTDQLGDLRAQMM